MTLSSDRPPVLGPPVMALCASILVLLGACGAPVLWAAYRQDGEALSFFLFWFFGVWPLWTGGVSIGYLLLPKPTTNIDKASPREKFFLISNLIVVLPLLLMVESCLYHNMVDAYRSRENTGRLSAVILFFMLLLPLYGSLWLIVRETKRRLRG